MNLPDDLFYRQGTPCDEARIAEIERNIQLELPDSYRELLMATGGGELSEKYSLSRRYCDDDEVPLEGFNTIFGNGQFSDTMRINLDSDARVIAKEWEYPRWGLFFATGYDTTHTPLILNVINPKFPKGSILYFESDLDELYVVYANFDEFLADVCDPYTEEDFDPVPDFAPATANVSFPPAAPGTHQPSPAQPEPKPDPAVPHVFAMEATDARFILPVIESTLLRPERTTPALEAFREAAQDYKWVADTYVAGDGVVGIVPKHSSPVSIAEGLSEQAIEHGVSLAVPHYGAVITRGTETSKFGIGTLTTDADFASPELVDEYLRRLEQRCLEGDTDDAVTLRDRRYEDLVYTMRGYDAETYIFTMRDFERSAWVVEYRDEDTGHHFALRTESLDEASRLMRFWMDYGDQVSSQAEWEPVAAPEGQETLTWRMVHHRKPPSNQL